MADLDKLLQLLSDARVDFVVIGGVAMVLRGSSRVTVDLDICLTFPSSGTSTRSARA